MGVLVVIAVLAGVGSVVLLEVVKVSNKSSGSIS